MRKKLSILMLLAALLVPWASRAQVTCDGGAPLTVSNADTSTTTSSYLPAYAFYNYSYSEQIILADDLNGLGTIKALMFKANNTTSSSYYTNCEIYLANTDAEDLSSGFIQDPASFELVYSGDLNWTSVGWRYVEFDEPFDYDGSSNLLVAIRRNHGSYSSGSQFAAYTASAQLGRYVYNDGGAYTIGSITSSGTATANVAWYQFIGCPATPVSCYRVRQFHADSIATYEVYLTWVDTLNGTSTTYTIYNMADSSVIATDVTGNTYTVTGLAANTIYQFGITADCGSDGESEFAKTTVRTGCAAVSYINEDFSNGNDPCWTMYSGYSSSYPQISSGGLAFYSYWSNGYSEYNSYAITPEFTDSLNLYEVEFDMTRYSSSATYPAHLYVGVVSDPDDITTFDTIAEFSANIYGQWESFHVSLENYHGDGMHVAFLADAVHLTDYSYSYNRPVIDNIYIGRISSCPKPSRLHARDITNNSAQIVWDVNDDYNTVLVKWGTVNNINNAIDSAEVGSTNMLNLTGLTAGTTYYVWASAQCSEEDSRIVSTDFTTLTNCEPVASFTVENVGYTAASFSWTPNSVLPATLYNFSWKADTATTWNNDTTSGTFYLLDGLTEGVSYNVTVAAACGETSTSSEVSANFTTLLHGTIGANEGTYYMPTYPVYNYSISEQMWTADELVDYGTTVNGIKFYSQGSIGGRVMDIWMANSTLTDITTDSHLGSDAMTLVFSDTVDIIEGWNTFTFTTPFTRNAANNLVVLVYDHTGSWLSFGGWVACNSNIHSLYSYQDDSPYSTTDLSSLNNVAVRAMMQLDATLTARTCSSPVPVVAEADENNVTVAWVPGLNETAWSVDYRVVGDTAWDVAAASVADTFFTIGSLNAATHYEFRIAALCSENESRYGYADGYTACGTFTAPYVETFNAMSSGDYVMSPCWVKGSSTGNTPYTVNITGNGMMMLMPVGSYVIFPQFTDAVNEMQLRAQFVVANTDIYTLVGVCEHPSDIFSMTVIDTLRNSAAGVPEWHTVTFDTYDNAEGYIAIYSSYNQSYFDNINLELMPSCKPADSLHASNITTTSAEISWAVPENATGYLVEYGEAGSGVTTAVSAASNSISLTGLHHSTTYEVTVRTACAALNDSSLTGVTLTFTTDCDVVDSLPYVMDFEHCNAPALTYTGILPNCWNYVMTGTNYNTGNNVPMLYLGNAQSGNYSLRMYGVGVVTLPEMPVGIDSLMISFHDYCSYNGYGLVIGVCDSNWGDFADSFVPVDTMVYDGDSYYYDFVCYGLASYTGTGRYIAFKNYYTSGSYHYDYSYHYIDDIVVDLLPNCLPIQNLYVSNTTLTDVTIDWTDLRPATNWEVAYSTTPLTDPSTGTVVSVTAHPYTLTSLADSDYYVYVRTVCSATEQSIWSSAVLAHPGHFNMRANASDTLQFCGGTIYDDGGAYNAYSASQNSTLVLTADSGYVVVLNGTTYTESSYDYLRIYDGIGTSGTELWNDYGSSSTNTIEDIASTTGPLTLVFHSDGSVQYSGFEINVSCESNACPISDIMVNPAGMLMTTSIPVIWTGSSSSYIIEYGEKGFVRGTGTAATSTTNSFTMTGLNPMTSYDFYVRGICAPDTSRWFKATLNTPICDNATIATNYDDTQDETTSYYSPIGYGTYDYSFTQYIIPADRLVNITSDITAFAFLPYNTTGGDLYTNIDMYMANVSEEDLTDGFILPSDTGYVFTQVVDSGDFCFTDTEWQSHGFDVPFVWDGHSNILVTVNRLHGDWSSSSSFMAHTDTVSRLRYAYRDNNPFDFSNVASASSYTSTAIGDIQLISCGIPCFTPANLTADTSSYNSLTFNWQDADSAEVVLMQGLWDEDNYDPATAQVVTTGTVTFSGLTYNTQYTVGVRQLCGEDMTSDWTLLTATTADLPCFAPGQPTVTAVDYYSATFTWTSNGIEQAWQVRVYNTTAEIIDTVTAMTCTTTGLTPNTSYLVEVSALCGAGYILMSEASPATTFTTSNCDVPTNVTATQVTHNSAVISWTGTGADKYELEYGDHNFNQGLGTKVTVTGGATTATLTGLEAENAYDVYVRAYCDETLFSDWSVVEQFTTTANAINDVNGSNINLYPNPASTSVTLTGLEGEATVAIVDVNGRVVYTENATNTLTIDLRGYAKGAYFVRITGEQTSAIRKLIVK